VNLARRLASAVLALALAGCSTSLDLGYNDAGVPYDADCKPGTYAGSYSCTAASTSLFPSGSLLGDGSIAVTLAPTGAVTLGVERDAALWNTVSGTMTMIGLSGVLDCASRRLTGQTGNVIFSSTAISGTVSGAGPFTAVYDPDASPPRLLDGVLDPPSSLSATCTWSATLQ
jgi:hypothetical protein